MVDRAGTPIAGLDLWIDREVSLVGLDHHFYGFMATGARGVTAADGTFELADVPRADVVLHVAGEGVSDPELDLGPAVDPDALRLTVGRTVHLQVEVGETYRLATAVSVLDAQGNYLQLSVGTGDGTVLAPSLVIAQGRTQVASLSDAGVTLVLFQGGEELARVPLALHGGEVNRVDL